MAANGLDASKPDSTTTNAESLNCESVSAKRSDPAKPRSWAWSRSLPTNSTGTTRSGLRSKSRLALSPDAMTGLEANLRFGEHENMESRIFGRLSAWQNWIFIRPNAVGARGALKVYGTGNRAKIRLGARVSTWQTASDSSLSKQSTILSAYPNNVDLADRPQLTARAGTMAAGVSELVERNRSGRYGSRLRSLLRTAISVDRDGWANFGYVRMPEYRWGIFLTPRRRRTEDSLWRPQGRAGLAGRSRRIPIAAAANHRHPRGHRAGFGGAAEIAGSDLPFHV